MKYRNIFTLLTIITFSVCAFGQSSLEQSKNKGKRIYLSNCVSCHMANGEGMTGAFPPLAKSDYLEDTEKTIEVILNGASGEMKVNGKSYYGAMVGYSMLTDQQVADVMNYIQNSWGNEAEIVDAEKVKKVRN
ncbi:cytochrome c [Algibacter sp. AS12]|uniref:c-type cytochrome n=1 Tax=Algibacter sp. AS12 TaxID=3135773 RepID=UPI00398AB7D8